MVVVVLEVVCPQPLWPHRLWPIRLLHLWDCPGKNSGVGCHFLLQGVFLMWGSSLGLQHCRQILYHSATILKLNQGRVKKPVSVIHLLSLSEFIKWIQMTRCIKSATEPVLMDQVLLALYPDSLGFLWPRLWPLPALVRFCFPCPCTKEVIRERKTRLLEQIWLDALNQKCSEGTSLWSGTYEYPFSSRSSWPRNQTRVFCIAGGFFINWAIRKAHLWIQEYEILALLTWVRVNSEGQLIFQCPLQNQAGVTLCGTLSTITLLLGFLSFLYGKYFLHKSIT